MNRQSLSASAKIKKTGDFQRVYQHGRRIRGNGFSLILLSTHGPESRLGVSVHKKTGNAVRRNRIKRLVREVFRLNRPMFPLSCDIVFTIRPDFTINHTDELKSRLAQILTA